VTARRVVLPLAACFLLTACATVPTGPSVLVLPGTAKNFEQFQTDDAVCRQWALQQTGTTPNEAGAASTVTGAAVGTAVGAGLGAAIGAAAGSPATGAAVGAGAGLLGARPSVPAMLTGPVSRCRDVTTSHTCSACTPKAIRCPSLEARSRHTRRRLPRPHPRRRAFRRRPPGRRRHLRRGPRARSLWAAFSLRIARARASQACRWLRSRRARRTVEDPGRVKAERDVTVFSHCPEANRSR